MRKIENLLTVAEVAKLFSVSDRTVRRWISLNKLPAIHINNSVRVKESAVKELMNPIPEDQLMENMDKFKLLLDLEREYRSLTKDQKKQLKDKLPNRFSEILELLGSID